jgi:hypothetical protein
MTISGRAQRMTNAELAASSQVYLHNLVTLGKLTGQTVEELNSQRETFMAQQRFASVQRDLEKQAREATARGDHAAAKRFEGMIERNRMIIDSVPKELQTGVADAMTGFLGTSEASMQLMRAMPEFAQMLASQNFEYSEALGVAEREAGAVLDNFASTLGAAGGFDEVFGSLAGFVKMEAAALNKSFPDRLRAAELEIQIQKEQQGAVADQASLRESQLLTAQNAQNLIGILRGPVTSGMQVLATTAGEASTALARIAGVDTRGAPAGAGTVELPTPAAVPVAPTGGAASTTLPASPAVALPTATSFAQTESPAAGPSALPINPARLVAPTATNLNVVNLPITPEFAQGGIATGPTSGYQAMLHGIEAVVPLSSGRSIPVSMPNMSLASQQQMDIMSQQMSMLDSLIKETKTNNTLTERLLKVAQS